MKMLKILLFMLIVSFVQSGCSASTTDADSDKKVILVSAASSLKEVLEEMVVEFQTQHKGIEVKFNFAASGTLKQQIEQGAPVDIFISASVDKFEELKDQSYIEDEIQLVSNELVLITSTNNQNLNQLLDIRKMKGNEFEKISIGTPSIVPAGDYAKQALMNLGIFDDIQDKIVYAKDVRQVLTYVETENVQAGFVYKTDAITSNKVKVIGNVGPEYHDPINYPAGILRNSKYPEESKLFLEYLNSEAVNSIWMKNGFSKN
ncbi:molybdate ABC transporter substrate-binding protein [Lysinibacillus sp. PLM2]|nr:molybdate ABC transporter substrate-binding protein [Lysinibacillus sp. PLM2]